MPTLLLATLDSEALLALTSAGLAQLYAAKDGSRIAGPTKLGGEPIAAVLDPDGRTAHVLLAEGRIVGLDLRELKLLESVLRVDGPGAAMVQLKGRLVAATARGLLQWFDPALRSMLFELSHDGGVSTLAATLDGSLVASAGNDATVRLWTPDAAEAAPALKLDDAATAVAFAPDAKRLATGSRKGQLRWWSTDGSAAANPTMLDGAVTAIAWHPSGKLMAAGSTKGDARLFDSRGRPIGEVMRHDGAVLALAFTPDGKRLVTAAEDGLARPWSVETGKPQGEPMKHDGKVEALAFASRGTLLATTASDARLRRFTLEDSRSAGVDSDLTARDPAPATAAAPLDPRTFTRIGSDAIVTVGGVVGVFTPVGGGATGPLGADERENLTRIIDRLKHELAAAQGTVNQLQSELDALRERPATASDFASGVQQSLDELAQRMSAMRNPVSNFAVREFKLDASVHVQVTPTGALEYRFVQPGDDAPAETVSKLSMSVVPLPKDNLAGVWSTNLFQPEVPVGALPGISDEQAQILERQGTFSIGEFLQTGTRLRAQVYLEALLRVDRLRLSAWVQQAALMTLRGIDGRLAVVLIAAGLGDFEALAASTPDAVVLAVTQQLQALPPGLPPTQPAPLPPSRAMAAQWIRAARQYLGLPPVAFDELPPAPPQPPPAPAPT
jgi:FtsZ-binding cell division protein ZapB